MEKPPDIKKQVHYIKDKIVHPKDMMYGVGQLVTTTFVQPR